MRFGGGGDPSAPTQGPVEGSPAEEQLKLFVGAALDSVQTTWDVELPRQARTPYRHASHHVQFLLGTESQVRSAMQSRPFASL